MGRDGGCCVLKVSDEGGRYKLHDFFFFSLSNLVTVPLLKTVQLEGEEARRWL